MKKKDPTSHRIIEKRRRDRMNNCLTDLSRLIPAHYIKKGRGRVEKTEIIEMAIKYLKDLIEVAGVGGGGGAGAPANPNAHPTAAHNHNHNYKQHPRHNQRNSTGHASGKDNEVFSTQPATSRTAICNPIELYDSIESDSDAEANNQQENKDYKTTIVSGNNAPGKPCSASNRTTIDMAQHSSSNATSAGKIDRMSSNGSIAGSESSLSSSASSLASSSAGSTSAGNSSGTEFAIDETLDMSFHEHSCVGRFGRGAANQSTNGTGSGSNSNQVVWYKKVLLVRAYSRAQQQR